MSNYYPRRNSWNAIDLFSRVKAQEVRLGRERIAHFREFFWNDLCAEWDSRNLYDELNRRHQRRPFSIEFMRFSEAWYQDEQNHANGFLRLLQLVCGETENVLLGRLRNRPVNFEFLDEFLADEFKLCVLFAYDEYATLQTFRKDTFYGEFGSPVFVEWIRRVRADESIHFMNLVRLIHYLYADRLSETKCIIERILEVETSLDGYHGTFLFDHEDSHFLLTEDDLTGECATRVLRRISRDPAARCGNGK